MLILSHGMHEKKLFYLQISIPKFFHFNFQIHDVGHSMLTLTFGVFFGISVSVIMHYKKIESSKESSTYISSIFSLLGTLVLWLYWVIKQ